MFPASPNKYVRISEGKKNEIRLSYINVKFENEASKVLRKNIFNFIYV